MKMIIELRMDNAAFEDNPIGEARDAINDALARLAPDSDGGFSFSREVAVADFNGNSVGFLRVEV